MSVINKMLRDLDARRAGVLVSPGTANPDNNIGATGVRYGSGVAGMAVAATGGGQHAGVWRAARARWIGVVVLATLAALAWLLIKPVRLAGVAALPALPALPARPVVVHPPASAVAAIAPVAVTLTKPAVMTPPATQAKPSHPTAVSGTALTTPVVRPTLPGAKASVTSSAGQVAGVVDNVASSIQPISGHVSLKPTSELSPVPVGGADDAPVTVAVQPQRAVSAPAVADALLVLVAQAQAFWRVGDRNSALKLLQGAMQQLESPPTSDARRQAAVVALVREYARCSLISGQAADVLATLDRLQPQLAGVADIWAIRGNAAQRLGQHAQAVAAYQQALALRPNEGRWMLGAAVSLAALGQTGAATVLAEKVHNARAMPPNVANYLRELGVVIRSD